MNAEKERTSSGNNMVVDAMKNKLGKEVQANSLKASAQVLAAGIRRVKTLGPVKEQHDTLMAMPDELRNEFIQALANRTIDPEWWRPMYDKARMLLPFGVPRVFWEKAKDGTLAAMLMTGMVGDRATQEAFAKRAELGPVEGMVAKALPWITKLDIEPDTRAMLEVLTRFLQAKETLKDALTLTRKYVETGTDEQALGEAMKGMQKTVEAEARRAPEVDNTIQETEDAANMATLPVEGDKATERDIALGQIFGPKETPEA